VAPNDTPGSEHGEEQGEAEAVTEQEDEAPAALVNLGAQIPVENRDDGADRRPKTAPVNPHAKLEFKMPMRSRLLSFESSEMLKRLQSNSRDPEPEIEEASMSNASASVASQSRLDVAHADSPSASFADVDLDGMSQGGLRAMVGLGPGGRSTKMRTMLSLNQSLQREIEDLLETTDEDSEDVAALDAMAQRFEQVQKGQSQLRQLCGTPSTGSKQSREPRMSADSGTDDGGAPLLHPQGGVLLAPPAQPAKKERHRRLVSAPPGGRRTQQTADAVSLNAPGARPTTAHMPTGSPQKHKKRPSTGRVSLNPNHSYTPTNHGQRTFSRSRLVRDFAANLHEHT